MSGWLGGATPLEAQYPPTRAYCARCRKEHLFWPRAYYLAKAREGLRTWLEAELERRVTARLRDEDAP